MIGFIGTLFVILGLLLGGLMIIAIAHLLDLHKTTPIIRLWSYLTGGTPVWLERADSHVQLTIARVTPFGKVLATTNWPDNNDTLILLKDGGTVAHNKWKWKPYKEGPKFPGDDK